MIKKDTISNKRVAIASVQEQFVYQTSPPLRPDQAYPELMRHIPIGQEQNQESHDIPE